LSDDPLRGVVFQVAYKAFTRSQSEKKKKYEDCVNWKTICEHIKKNVNEKTRARVKHARVRVGVYVLSDIFQSLPVHRHMARPARSRTRGSGSASRALQRWPVDVTVTTAAATLKPPHEAVESVVVMARCVSRGAALASSPLV